MINFKITTHGKDSYFIVNETLLQDENPPYVGNCETLSAKKNCHLKINFIMDLSVKEYLIDSSTKNT